MHNLSIKKLLIVMAAFAGTGVVQAAELKIAVINPMAVIAASAQYKNAVADIEKDLADEKARLTKLQSDLNVCNQKISTDGATLSATDYAKLKTDCQTKYGEFQSLGQSYNKIAAEREQGILKDIGPKFQKALDAVVAEGGYDLVVQKEALLFAKPGFDVSDKVTIKLNTAK